MNYIIEIKEFYDWLESNELSESAINLWHALMHTANKTRWQNHFSVAISTLKSKTKCSKDALYRARNQLKQKGRIDFIQRKGNQSAVYEIISFQAFQSDFVSEIETQTATQNNTTNSIASCGATQSATQSATQIATQTATINKLKHKQNKTEYTKDITEKDSMVKAVIDFLNEKTGANYKSNVNKNRDLIKARQNEGFTLQDFKTVIEVKCEEWGNPAKLGDKDMRKYLRPETLFGTKFESYLNQNLPDKKTKYQPKEGDIW